MKHLGENLDLHCGGIDNAFPHHTNEIAQSEAFLGHPWCSHWMHVYHLNTTSGKMSKSSGEFLTVSLLEEKGYDPLVYRFFCLQSHYRKTLVFSYENLDNAAVAYNKVVARIATLKKDGEIDAVALANMKKGFTDALDNDLNTSLAITALYDALKFDTNDATRLAAVADFDTVLGLGLITAAEKAGKPSDDECDPEIDALVSQRTEAKKAKNWAEADRIRDELKARGIIVEDTAQGPKWHRV